MLNIDDIDIEGDDEFNAFVADTQRFMNEARRAQALQQQHVERLEQQANEEDADDDEEVVEDDDPINYIYVDEIDCATDPI